VRRGFCRSLLGSAWSWDFAQGSCSLMAGSQELPRELVEVCEEVGGCEK
jgi:hypothetical protein